MKLKLPDPIQALLDAGKKKSAVLTRIVFQRSVWTTLAAVLAIALGIFLSNAPVGEFASGRALRFESLVTLCWLATGLATFAAGVAILLRMPSFRRFLSIAFACSLPVVAYCLYKTVRVYVDRRGTTGDDREELRILASGLALVSFVFAGVSAFLYFLLHWKLLKQLNCSGRVMAGRAGPVIAGVIGAAIGGGVACLVWLVFRWLGTDRSIEVFRDVIYILRFEYFFAGGALPGAVIAVLRHKRRRGTPPSAAPSQGAHVSP